jgi:hypothetical protein
VRRWTTAERSDDTREGQVLDHPYAGFKPPTHAKEMHPLDHKILFKNEHHTVNAANAPLRCSVYVLVYCTAPYAPTVADQLLHSLCVNPKVDGSNSAHTAPSTPTRRLGYSCHASTVTRTYRASTTPPVKCVSMTSCESPTGLPSYVPAVLGKVRFKDKVRVTRR